MPTAIIMHFIECHGWVMYTSELEFRRTANRDLLTAESGTWESCGVGV